MPSGGALAPTSSAATGACSPQAPTAGRGAFTPETSRALSRSASNSSAESRRSNASSRSSSRLAVSSPSRPQTCGRAGSKNWPQRRHRLVVMRESLTRFCPARKARSALGPRKAVHGSRSQHNLASAPTVNAGFYFCITSVENWHKPLQLISCDLLMSCELISCILYTSELTLLHQALKTGFRFLWGG